MKKLFYSVLLLSGMVLGSCSQNDEPLNGRGVLQVDLSTDFSFIGERDKIDGRAVDANAYQQISNYTLKLTKTSDGSVVKEGLYSEWPLQMELESGAQYKMEASYGKEEPASFDGLLVTGNETFTLNPGTTKKLEFQCKPTAAKISVNYDKSFDTYYSDCEVSVKTKHMTDAFKLAKANDGQDLYIKADAAGEEVVLNFNLKDKTGETTTLPGVPTEKTLTIKPQTFLKITFKPEVTEIEGGKFGLQVVVDNGVTQENIDIVVPNDVIK